MKKNDKIYIAGHTGMLGSALQQQLINRGFDNIITASRQEIDLTVQGEVRNFLTRQKPDYVFICAAKVGGISANMNYPVDFLYDNLEMELNLINGSFLSGVKKLLFFGSACAYPADAKQPVKEDALLHGRPEVTNEAYAVAKIAGIKLCQAYCNQYQKNFISAIPTNAYGPGDDFDLETSHVIPAMIKKFHQAKVNKTPEVVIWGTGRPTREFIYVDDWAEAAIFLMDNYNSAEPVNIGSGEEISIGRLAEIVKDITGFNGKIIFDRRKPDGIKRKALDSTRINKLGWRAQTRLLDGLKSTYCWYLNNSDHLK